MVTGAGEYGIDIFHSDPNEMGVTAMMIMPLRNGLEETPGVVVPLSGLTRVCD